MSEEKKILWKMVERVDQFGQVLDEWGETINDWVVSMRAFDQRLTNLEIFVIALKERVDALEYEIKKRAPV